MPGNDYRRLAAVFSFSALTRVDDIERNFVKHQVSQERIQPAKLLDVFLVRGLLRGFCKPANDRFLPCATRLDAEPLLLPQRYFQLVVVFLGLSFVFSPSAALYCSSAVADLDPPMR